MPTKPARRAKSGRPAKRRTSLPTAAQFEAMTVQERTRVFAAWLKRQPRRKAYDFLDSQQCVMGTFARALFRDQRAFGVVRNIFDAHQRPLAAYRSVFAGEAIVHSETFGQASDAFHAALKRR